MKTYQPKKKEVSRQKHSVDASGQILGRLATKIAGLLMGKGKINYSTHMDMGDFVNVTNPDKVILTGKKEAQKVYRGHSGYPGGFKETTIQRMREKAPERILQHAVSGMLPDNRLKKVRMGRLRFETK